MHLCPDFFLIQNDSCFFSPGCSQSLLSNPRLVWPDSFACFKALMPIDFDESLQSSSLQRVCQGKEESKEKIIEDDSEAEEMEVQAEPAGELGTKPVMWHFAWLSTMVL